jgi:hypothetical protein
MKDWGNCRSKKHTCKYWRGPLYHAGFTGKSGPETWNTCVKHKKAIRNIKDCEIKGSNNHEETRNETA